MKIESVYRMESYLIDTDDEPYSTYIRHSVGGWSARMGESDEPIYNEKKLAELEKVFQKWITQNTPS